uniref:Uncharacterized protein n=1 Tax=Anopheles maculatus TaxID=74869 RepID=A0A182SKM2_9DIPT
MVGKLPAVLKRDWFHYRSLLSVPTIDDFSDWMEKEVEAASYDALPSLTEPKTERKPFEGRRNKPTTYLNTMENQHYEGHAYPAGASKSGMGSFHHSATRGLMRFTHRDSQPSEN